MMQKLGKADETKDTAFEEGVANFSKQMVRFILFIAYYLILHFLLYMAITWILYIWIHLTI